MPVKVTTSVPISIESAATTIRFVVPITSKVLPVLVKPAPAVICPAPENCTKVRAVVPRVTVPSFVRIQPESALVVPSSTKVNIPPVTLAFVSASVALVHAPPETTR